MISQNFGARNTERIRAFLRTAGCMVALFSLIFIAILMTISEPLIYLFVDNQNSSETVSLALEFVTYVWPLFLFAGFNMLISGYLTALHLPFQSGLVALCRSLVLPTGFLFVFYVLIPDHRFVTAISVSEGFAFLLALAFFVRHTPGKAVSDEPELHPC